MRILTYNIRGGLGIDGRRDTERIADFARDLAPDIACFQEVHQRLPWSGWINQPRVFADRLGMPFVFQKCVRLPWGGYGLGIATRYPTASVKRHRLRSQGETRGALRVQIATPHGPVSILCTHLGLNEKERAIQTRQIAALVNRTTHPVVVCGDFNEAANGDAVCLLLEETGLQDAGQAQDTPTYPADTPRARIDLVLHSKAWSAQQVLTMPSLLSDHLPLVVELSYGAGGDVEEDESGTED